MHGSTSVSQRRASANAIHQLEDGIFETVVVTLPISLRRHVDGPFVHSYGM